MKEQIVKKIQERTDTLNRIIEHRDMLKKELGEANLEAERIYAKIMELKELLDELSQPVEETEKAEEPAE